MKKNVKTILLILSIAGIIIAVYKLANTIIKKDQANAAMRRLPDFSFQRMDNSIFTKEMLSKDSPVLIIFFSPDCEHCTYEADEIKKNIARLSHCNILMISPDPIDRIRQFDSVYQLSAHPSIKLLRDGQDAFYRTFATRMIPSVFIYDKNGNLAKQYLGEVKMDAIYKYL